ncbi:MAG: hypothetical protein PHT33_05540 [bacterium]|nr:hypothetical protein [bacterium]
MKYHFRQGKELIGKIYKKRSAWVNWVILIVCMVIARVTRDNAAIFFLPVVLWSKEHNYITKAALEVLTEPERKFLEPEKDLLWKIYCEFPDLNWAHYGCFGGESGSPDMPRTTDIRREWDISYYCGFDPVTYKVPDYIPGMLSDTKYSPSFHHKKMYKEDFGYCPMGSYEAPARYFPKVIDCWRDGRLADGMRFLGVLLHHVEDRGAFAYWPDLHIKGHVANPEEAIRLEGYTPQKLGMTIDEAVADIEQRMHALLRFTEGNVPAVDAAWKAGDISAAEGLILKNALENVRAVADVIHTAIGLVDCNLSVSYWCNYHSLPTMINLLQNPGFEISDGTDIPVGWVVRYHDLQDRVGRAEWVWGRLYSMWFTPVRSGEHALKLMWTPPQGIEWRQRWTCAVPVKAAQVFEYSGWMKTEKATGASYLVIYFYTRDNELILKSGSKEIQGSTDWQRISLKGEVPEHAEKAVVACRSDGNNGAVWFDDLELNYIAG